MTAPIPDEVREAAIQEALKPWDWEAIFNGEPGESPEEVLAATVDAVTPILAAHFAKERDDLQAVIAEVRREHGCSSLVDGQELCDGCHEPVPCETMHIVTRAPSGTADRLRAEGWERGKHDSTEISWNGTSYTLEARQDAINPFLTPKGADSE